MRKSLIIASVALAGCASQPKEAARVDLSDGVNAQESSVIVDDYLRQHLNATLGHTGPYDGGNVWLFRITGDAAPIELVDIPPVLVDKSSGVVTWKAKPPLKK